MKVAVLSESPSDEAAIRILIDAILGVQTTPIDPPRLRSRGWPSVRDVLPAVIKHLHYQTDADVLAVVVDSDDSPVHTLAHEQDASLALNCRLCALRGLVDEVRATLKPRAGRTALRIAIGLAVPCLEAWFVCGTTTGIDEAASSRDLREGKRRRPRRLELKRLAYGCERLSSVEQTRKAMEAARRVGADLQQLASHFPGGFGSFQTTVRSWTCG